MSISAGPRSASAWPADVRRGSRPHTNGEVIVRLAAGVLLGALAERVLVFELSFEVVKRSGVVTWKLASRAAREGSMCSAGGSVRPC